LVTRRQALFDFAWMDLRSKYNWDGANRNVIAINRTTSLLEKSLAERVNAGAADASEIELAGEKYLDAALKSNPVVQNLDVDETENSLWAKYRAYCLAGRPPKEQAAYDEFVRTLLKVSGVSIP
jgi:hypothetical protein